MSFPNRGEGGGGHPLGKIPTFSRFFFGNVPNCWLEEPASQLGREQAIVKLGFTSTDIIVERCQLFIRFCYDDHILCCNANIMMNNPDDYDDGAEGWCNSCTEQASSTGPGPVQSAISYHREGVRLQNNKNILKKSVIVAHGESWTQICKKVQKTQDRYV